MNRLKKKCVIATVGAHLLLLTILIAGPAFYNPRPQADNVQVLDMIPANLIDAALNSGVRHATPPAPAPDLAPPSPVPPAPTPIVRTAPPPPAPKPVEARPKVSFEERVKKIFEPKPSKTEPARRAPERAEPRRHEIQVNTQLVTRGTARNSRPETSRHNSRDINSAIANLRRNLSPGMVVDMPGAGDAAYASYKDALATIYYNAWQTPNGASPDDADTIVKIVVASDGTVLSARIVTPSGDARTDASVQRALNRVSSVPPLPDKSRSEREFTIDFNLKAKQMLE